MRSAGAAADDEPVRDDELDALFSFLASFRLLVLAVSGGADSTALMLLARRWSQSIAGAPAIAVATVDHGLRADSGGECRWVERQAASLGLEASVLAWTEKKPSTGIQDAARAARYELLAGFARARGAGPAAIVTAHTEDDQAETLLMRLARGSGLEGLSAMTSLRPLDKREPQVMLARPLLGVSGARLRATLRAAGHTWIDDPSNDAERFERVRVRKARAALAGLGLTNDKLALSARRLARAGEAFDAAVSRLQQDARLDVHGGAFASFDAAAWRAAPEELRLRLLRRLVGSFGGQGEPLPLAQLEDLVARMADAGFAGATLCGARISAHGSAIHVEREAGRAPPTPLVLQSGASGIWDHRFRVAAARESQGPVEVQALGAKAYAQLRRQLGSDPPFPASAAAMLPAFRRGAELLCVPALVGLPEAQALWAGNARLFTAEFLG